MCGICGVYNPCKIDMEDIKIFSILLHRSELRGKDATGIFTQNLLHKEPILSYEFLQKNVELIKGENQRTKYMLGHTRAYTRGSPKIEKNNHPLPSEAGNGFAITHNGVVFLTEYGKEKGLVDEKEFVDSRLIVKALDMVWDPEHPVESVNESFKYHRGRATVAIGLENGELILVTKNNPLYYYRKEKGQAIYYAQDISFFHKDLERRYIKKVSNNKIVHVKLDGDMSFTNLDSKATEGLYYERYESCSTYYRRPYTKTTKKKQQKITSYTSKPRATNQPYMRPNREDLSKPLAICEVCNTSWFIDSYDNVECPTCNNKKPSERKQNIKELYKKTEQEKGIKISKKKKAQNFRARRKRTLKDLPKDLQEIAIQIENELDTQGFSETLKTVPKIQRKGIQTWYFSAFNR